MLKWSDPVGFIPGATPSVRKAWGALGVETIGDLLTTLPRRYEDYSKTKTLFEAEEGESLTARVEVVSCKIQPGFRQRIKMIRLVVRDASGSASASFFNQPWLVKELTPGREIFLSGTMEVHPRFGRQVSKPLWEPADAPSLVAGKIAPVYPLSGSLAQKTYRRLIQTALADLEYPDDWFSAEERTQFRLPTVKETILGIHEPKTIEDTERARARLAFEESFFYRLAFDHVRAEAEKHGAITIPFQEAFAKRFVEGLPFPLTGDQKRAVWMCFQDLASGKPVRRLLQGDVGSGKTIVAAFVAAEVVRQGYSVAFLVPTDILAQQHAETLKRTYAAHGVPLLLITRTKRALFFNGEEEALSPDRVAERLRQGGTVVLGTHALLEQDRLPDDLALAIVDEQHRFGVNQRQFLVDGRRKDGRVPHLLSMTATPIPRSLALTLFGDLDISIIKEKPKGRLPVFTEVCAGGARDRAYLAIRSAVERGERAFIVCPLIDPSDALGVSSATEEWKRLSQGPLAGLSLGLLHGRLKTQEKDQVMDDFLAGKYQVLVSTSVIEVGVDVPQATVMAIEGAERFGLAQLHQLRGRVGRSSIQSYCYLLTDVEGEPLERLKRVAATTDGFILAEEDYRRRGAGNLLGTIQSGHFAFRALRPTDLELMAKSREAARVVLGDDPDLQKHPHWKRRVEMLLTTAHLE